MKYRARRFFGTLFCRLFGHDARIEEPERMGDGRIFAIVRCDRCRSVLDVEPLFT